jgi:formylglycine-generating enzyme required for sulfatase activity
MKKLYVVGGAVIVILVCAASLLYVRSDGRNDRLRYERGETEVIISNLPNAPLTLFKAGTNLQDSEAMPPLSDDRIWLPKGSYYLIVVHSARTFFYPLPIVAYRGGPDKEGALNVTIRPPSTPPAYRLLPDLPDFVFIPSGHFLFGDRQRINEPHYVWLGAFFISPFETTNAEFREFLIDAQGYSDDRNWSEAGRKWKANNKSHATALLKPEDSDYQRFGQPDQPVVQVNWFEANAFARWQTKTFGGGKWIFSLPTEAEWEKAARGPDNFDYGLGQSVSDAEAGLYNWRKNPGAPVTVVGLIETKSKYQPSRYGIYHMTGNVAEWTQSVYRHFNRQHPYVDDDDRNHDDVPGERVLRGGSWYTASSAVLYIPYRENFRPEIETPYLGFRVVARAVP